MNQDGPDLKAISRVPSLSDLAPYQRTHQHMMRVAMARQTKLAVTTGKGKKTVSSEVRPVPSDKLGWIGDD